MDTATLQLALPLETPEALANRWRAAWAEALSAWSALTMMREPTFLFNDKEASGYGMAGQIAAIRLADQTVMVNMKTIREFGPTNHPMFGKQAGNN